jgi:hypothetical protein
MRFVPISLLLFLLTGCIVPDPHTSLRSDEIVGKVLDEHTRAPVQGAKVFFSEHPNLSCKSDSDGMFRLKETHNFTAVLIAGGGAVGYWPSQDYWWPYITVSHTNYAPYEFDWVYRTDRVDSLVILLKPKK